jgi:hypothetical protein
MPENLLKGRFNGVLFLIYYIKKHFKPSFFILKVSKDILQHFDLVNSWIGSLVVSFFWCHEQVTGYKGWSYILISFSEIIPPTLLFEHPYTFIRNQKNIPLSHFCGAMLLCIWPYNFISFSDIATLTLLSRLILYSEL